MGQKIPVIQSNINIFWFRRDLRLEDNVGLFHALNSGLPVVALFIFDTNILNDLDPEDARVTFIHNRLEQLNLALKNFGSSFRVESGKPVDVWKKLLKEYKVNNVFTNYDYEPYAISRDKRVQEFLNTKNVTLTSYKDQVIFEKEEVQKANGLPYTVYTPYMKKWLALLSPDLVSSCPSEKYLNNFHNAGFKSILPLEAMGFRRSKIDIPIFDISEKLIFGYQANRDFPYIQGTSGIGPYLRFGFIGIRHLVSLVKGFDLTFLKELVWREFFKQILYHFPFVVSRSFKPKYERIHWINNEELFEKWCQGNTGYPMVDAGMRQLKETGNMHNRVRMITASFLCKHLLTDWRWGEAWFAKHLLDYDLSSNNGNWQWAAGSGCDAAPYFRVFSPALQQKKFDPQMDYVKKWVPEILDGSYAKPIIEHDFARKRAIATYKQGLIE